MSKKIYAMLLPVVAVVAFAVVPSVASAQKTYGTCAVGTPHSGNCPSATTEHFTEFAPEKRVPVFGNKVSAKFVLETETGKGKIECPELETAGLFWNTTGGVGHSDLKVAFERLQSERHRTRNRLSCHCENQRQRNHRRRCERRSDQRRAHRRSQGHN